MATSSFYKTSEETSYCDPCHVIKHMMTDAKYTCVDCGHELCETCLEYHKQTLSTRNHTVTELQNGKKIDFQVSGRRPDGVNDKQTKNTRSQSDQVAPRQKGRNRILGNIRKALGISSSPDSSTQPSRSDGIADKQTKTSKSRSDQVVSRNTKRPCENQNRGLKNDVQGMSLSPIAKPSTSNTGQVYKTLTFKKGLSVFLESDDKPCSIKGIVMVQDKIIVTDDVNSKLKVFDSHGKFQFDYKIDNAPWDIDILDDTTVVVSGRHMKVLSLGNTSMTELLKINTEYPCYGVCCHNGHIYCVLRDSPALVSQVCVYTPDGKFRRRFEYLSDGEVDCSYLYYITINPKTDILYITDWTKGVVALSTSGDVIAVMFPPKLKHPHGITVDDHGQIYICGVNSNNLIQMSVDGQNAVEILSDNARCIWPQCVKIYGNTLLLARQHSDTVSMYELSSRSERFVVSQKNKTAGDQNTDQTSDIQGMSLTPGTKPSISNRGQVYKRLTLKKGLKVLLESDNGPCEIKGFVMVQDRFIITDNANSKLKVFDSHYRFQYEYNCDDKPFDIGVLDNTTIVVSSELGRNVKVLSLGNTGMTELVKIKEEYKCYGVCCHNEKIYIVISNEIVSKWFSQVSVYTPDGMLRRRIEYLSDGKVDCNNLTYITINPLTDILYITEWNKGVVALSTNGDVIAIVSPPQVKNPQGIAVDDHGHIFVCGVNSSNVIQMSANGNNAVEILSNNARCRSAQCVKIYGNTLLLARRHSDIVSIYELS